MQKALAECAHLCRGQLYNGIFLYENFGIHWNYQK